MTKPTVSLKQIMLRVNSNFLPFPTSWIVGSAVQIENPRLHGLVHRHAAQNPHNDKFGPFAPTARADGKKLTWKTGSDTVEITSETDIHSRNRRQENLWVYTDRAFKSPATIPPPVRRYSRISRAGSHKMKRILFAMPSQSPAIVAWSRSLRRRLYSSPRR